MTVDTGNSGNPAQTLLPTVKWKTQVIQRLFKEFQYVKIFFNFS
jgi:hypothetical protein